MRRAGVSVNRYPAMYRLGVRPWERYASSASADFARLLDREEQERPSPPGRALDLGCGRGIYTLELARRGLVAVGVDRVPRAIAEAQQRAEHGASFVVADVTALPPELGTFDFFLDIGCLQCLGDEQREAEARGVTALANPGATALLLEFGLSWMTEGVSQEQIERAFASWDLVDVEPAPIKGLGWPMNTTSPKWYRLRRRTDQSGLTHEPP